MILAKVVCINITCNGQLLYGEFFYSENSYEARFSLQKDVTIITQFVDIKYKLSDINYLIVVCRVIYNISYFDNNV